jgi:hypothetical protein
MSRLTPRYRKPLSRPYNFQRLFSAFPSFVLGQGVLIFPRFLAIFIFFSATAPNYHAFSLFIFSLSSLLLV